MDLYNGTMPKRRSYFLESTGSSVPASKLKKLSQEKQIEVMRSWFYRNYASPDDLPYDSSEGGYQWIWGGPYDAKDALDSEFSGLVSEDAFETLISELEDISSEWSGIPSDDDFDHSYLDDLIASGVDPFMTLIGSMQEIESAARIRTTTKRQKVLHKLLFANVVTALETFLGDTFMKSLSKSDQYVEDFVRKTGKFQNTTFKLSEIFDRFKKIDSEVRTLVLAHNWHMMEDSAKMYKRAFNIKFPEISETLKKGISERHDIVHRNGKTKDGNEGTWDLTKILALQEAVVSFARDIDQQAKQLPSTEKASSAIDHIDPIEI